MDSLGNLLEKKQQPKTNKKIHSELHYWTDKISTAFGEKKKFGMYLGIIKRIGIEEAQKIFNEIMNSNVDNPGRLFVWKTKKANQKKFMEIQEANQKKFLEKYKQN